MKDVRYIDVSGAMALLTFIEQSRKAGMSVKLEQVHPHVEKQSWRWRMMSRSNNCNF